VDKRDISRNGAGIGGYRVSKTGYAGGEWFGQEGAKTEFVPGFAGFAHEGWRGFEKAGPKCGDKARIRVVIGDWWGWVFDSFGGGGGKAGEKGSRKQEVAGWRWGGKKQRQKKTRSQQSLQSLTQSERAVIGRG
jgi:hypothetical protein